VTWNLFANESPGFEGASSPVGIIFFVVAVVVNHQNYPLAVAALVAPYAPSAIIDHDDNAVFFDLIIIVQAFSFCILLTAPTIISETTDASELAKQFGFGIADQSYRR
jgi:hypothetical protein